MNVFERGFLASVPHEALQRCNAHVFIRLMCAEGVSESVHTHLFADAGFPNVLSTRKAKNLRIAASFRALETPVSFKPAKGGA